MMCQSLNNTIKYLMLQVLVTVICGPAMLLYFVLTSAVCFDFYDDNTSRGNSIFFKCSYKNLLWLGNVKHNPSLYTFLRRNKLVQRIIEIIFEDFKMNIKFA